MSTDRWMDKKVVHMHNGILLRYKKEHIWVNSDEVVGPKAYYTEWSNSERKNIIIYQCIYMMSIKMVLMILFEGKQMRHRHKEQTFGHSGGGMTWEGSIKICTLPYIK